MLGFLLFIIFVIFGYICGSFCSAIIVSRLFSLPDPRLEGSLNPGATNVLRLAGKKYAALVLVGDMLKGFIPVILARSLGLGPIITSFTCLAAVVGHMYPVFFKFQGGKGVATALGGLLGLSFVTGIATIVIWLIVANFTGYASLASIIALIFAPLYSILGFGSVDVFIPLFFMTFLIIYKHRNNINRLIDRDEPKLSFSKHRFSDVTEDIVVDEQVNQAFEEEEKTADIIIEDESANKPTEEPIYATADQQEDSASEPPSAAEQPIFTDPATPETVRTPKKKKKKSDNEPS
ncbi:transmembrane protein [Legionella busanensis]|uniref:Glycerol-3-phosphate acyltransferase n=1 Tax=Legionella busanensis TaxID=190655 RepID=A0A378JH89_9GAMM|nr:glycerol-3-phosphate 1-O-acyltransferase PlsY [Legionella busanensis]STX50494.1 transmembrane protein [Legionella busanensis]